ncbi:MAG: cytidine deaminase [Candidatus Cloacimonadaceae bacterium]
MILINEARKKELIELAKEASHKAYAPYSKFKVGAALLTSSGKIYTGCNVENASYSLTICAERNAVFQAVADGQKDIAAIVIYVESDQNFPPCGACRQVLAEFAQDMPVFIANRKEVMETTLAALLPEKFSLPNE